MNTHAHIIYNPNDPDMKKAFDLAEKLSLHCRKANLPESFIIHGVAWRVSEVTKNERKEGILEGRAYEKGRIAELLGLSL